MAVSRGQRNELSEFLSRHHTTEGLPRAPVEGAVYSQQLGRLGKNWRTPPLVFSFEPHRHGYPASPGRSLLGTLPGGRVSTASWTQRYRAWIASQFPPESFPRLIEHPTPPGLVVSVMSESMNRPKQ